MNVPLAKEHKIWKNCLWFYNFWTVCHWALTRIQHITYNTQSFWLTWFIMPTSLAVQSFFFKQNTHLTSHESDIFLCSCEREIWFTRYFGTPSCFALVFPARSDSITLDNAKNVSLKREDMECGVHSWLSDFRCPSVMSVGVHLTL